MAHDNISYAKRKIFSNKYNLTKIFGITIFLLMILILLTVNVNAVGLDVNGVTVTKCGTETYDYVNISNGGIINICAVGSGGFWNVTATNYFYVSSNSIINATNSGANGGIAGTITCADGGVGGTGNSGNNGNAGGTGGGGGGHPQACGPAAGGGSGGTQASIISDSNSRYGIFYGSGSGGSGAGGSNGCYYSGGSGSSGVNGGGAIKISSPTINIFGKIIVNGFLGNVGGNAYNGCESSCGAITTGGGGGGGSGGSGAGSIVLDGLDVNISNAYLYATGGVGGAGGLGKTLCTFNGANGQQGQGGAGGRIKIFYKTLSNISTTYYLSGGTGSSSGTAGSIYYENILTTLNATLYSPFNNYATSTSPILFQCIGEINYSNYGVNLANISLYTNSTGTWKINQTNTVIGTINSTFFSLPIASTGAFNWTCEVCSDDNVCTFANENRSAQYNPNAPTIAVYLPSGTYSASGMAGHNGTILPMNYAITSPVGVLDKCWYLYNGVNTFINCTDSTKQNVTQINGYNSLIVYANDTAGNVMSQFTSWSYEVLINNQTYNSSTYETATENFIMSITYDNVTYSGITANLVYNGISYSGTKVGTGATISFSKQLDAPTVTAPTNKSFYWNIVLIKPSLVIINSNSTNNNQTVNPILFSRCNSTNIVTYINYTYKDEMEYFYINASIPSANFNYWLGSGTVIKTYFFSNSTETSYTDFCFSPENKTLNANWIYQAGSTGYITRTFNSIINYSLTNSSTGILYYLIQSADSGAVTIQVLDLTSASPISGARVTVTRDIQGTQTTIADGYTDAAGTMAVYLSSVVSYTITVSKSGCGSNTQTITPVGSYTMNLNCAGNTTKFVSFIDGVTYQRGPNTGVSIPGNTVFNYYVSSLIYPIVSVRFELRDNIGTGALLAYNQTDVSAGYSWCNATSCLLTINYYTASGDNIKGRYYINLGNQTNYTYVLLEKDAYWRYIMINANNSQQAWKRTVLHFDDFMYVWTGGNAQTNCLVYKTNDSCLAVPVCKWLNRTEWDPRAANNFTKNVEFCMLKDDINKLEFSRVLIIFFVLVIILFVMGRGIGYEMTNPGSFVLFLSILITILSIAGMFTFSGLTPWDWFNQYIYAYICVTFALGYNLSIIRRYSA